MPRETAKMGQVFDEMLIIQFFSGEEEKWTLAG